MKFLSRAEEMGLLTIWKITDGAYGVNIREHLSQMTGRYWSIGSVYVPLDRLENKGFIDSYLADPTPERGGKSKRYYKLTDEGINELKNLQKIYDVFWSDIADFPVR